MTEIVLGGEVKSQFTYGKPEDFALAADAARREQEEICGYPLVLMGGLRQTHSKDSNGNDVFEVFATFAPAPPPPPIPKSEPLPVTPWSPGDGTQVYKPPGE